MRWTFLILSFWLCGAGFATASSHERPHIVFVFADDLGVGDLGCYGGKVAPTPNLDRMAAEGLQVEQFYVASPVCSPSRCGLITGQWPARWKITSYLGERARNRGAEQRDYLDPRAPSLPRLLKSAGYRTAHIGKWHLGGGRDVTDAPKFAEYGYDEHVSTHESPEPEPDITSTDWIWARSDKVPRWKRTEYFVDRTLEFLKQNHSSRPCFVNLWLDDLHTPWVPNEEAPDKGGNVQENLVPVLEEMDRQIGRLFEGLKALGIGNRTLVIFTGDNGPYPHLEGRTLRLRGCKFSLYEGGIRIPFLVCWPGKIPGGVVDDASVIAAVDMLPTLCAIGGAEMPEGVEPDGQDISRVFFGKSLEVRSSPLMWEYGRNKKYFGYPRQPEDRSPNLAIRHGKWKLLVDTNGKQVELYDLSVDVGEANNLAGARPEVTDKLKREVIAWRRSMP